MSLRPAAKASSAPPGTWACASGSWALRGSADQRRLLTIRHPAGFFQWGQFSGPWREEGPPALMAGASVEPGRGAKGHKPKVTGACPARFREGAQRGSQGAGGQRRGRSRLRWCRGPGQEKEAAAATHALHKPAVARAGGHVPEEPLPRHEHAGGDCCVDQPHRATSEGERRVRAYGDPRGGLLVTSAAVLEKL